MIRDNFKDIYEVCPEFEKGSILLKKTTQEDAIELLKCYSDELAVPLFNSDNCHGDDFHYTNMERMQEAIAFWDTSYREMSFVRWTIVFKENGEKIGTIEMFHRLAEDEFNHYGMLRIDLQSKYEVSSIIDDLLDIVNQNFYECFNVDKIITKAVPMAKERIISLENKGYRPLTKKVMIYDHYYCREKVD